MEKLIFPENYVNKIICADCLSAMKDIPDNSIDCIITDPPYNAKNIGPNKKIYDNTKMQISNNKYKKFCKNWFEQCKRISKKILFTPGISNTHNYPQPFWQICWHKPAAVSFNRMGGFNAWEPVFVYGKTTKARMGQDYIKINTLNFSRGVEKNHPCPKPIALIKILTQHFSKPNDLILDPFAGSGTTCVAAKELGRRFIGIEISEKYCKIANERLRQEILL